MVDNQIDMFNIINTRNENPDTELPKSVKLKEKEMWCPYCSKPAIFKKHKNLGVKKCPYCGISENDYNVKQVNKRWL